MDSMDTEFRKFQKRAMVALSGMCVILIGIVFLISTISQRRTEMLNRVNDDHRRIETKVDKVSDKLDRLLTQG